MATVSVRFWAGAQRAAGHDVEQFDVASIAELRAALAERPALRQLSRTASFLVDGVQKGESAALAAGARIDLLPPFAGG